jgi:hypothetical protein
VADAAPRREPALVVDAPPARPRASAEPPAGPPPPDARRVVERDGPCLFTADGTRYCSSANGFDRDESSPHVSAGWRGHRQLIQAPWLHRYTAFQRTSWGAPFHHYAPEMCWRDAARELHCIGVNADQKFGAQPACNQVVEGVAHADGPCARPVRVDAAKGADVVQLGEDWLCFAHGSRTRCLPSSTEWRPPVSPEQALDSGPEYLERRTGRKILAKGVVMDGLRERAVVLRGVREINDVGAILQDGRLVAWYRWEESRFAVPEPDRWLFEDGAIRPAGAPRYLVHGGVVFDDGTFLEFRAASSTANDPRDVPIVFSPGRLEDCFCKGFSLEERPAHVDPVARP